MTRYTLPIALLGGATLAQPALAELSYGPLTAEVTIELQSDMLFDSSNPANEVNDTYMTIEGGLRYAFTDRTSANATLVIEPIIGAVGDRVLEDHGAYVEEFFLAHDFGPVEVIAGKFNPAFGMAWDIAPGLYGTDFAEDYETLEKIGAGVNVPFAFAGGEHVLSFAVFNADRTGLSESLGRRRPQSALNAGGVSNTDDPESFTISLAGAFGDTAYNFGVQSQARGAGDVADQTGIVAGVAHSFAGGALPVDVLAEVAHFDDFGGTRNSATIGTFGASIPAWTGAASAVVAFRDVQGSSIDRLATLAWEVPLSDNLSTTIAYRYAEEGGDDNQTVGSVFVYEF